MKLKILVSAPYMQPVIDQYLDVFEAHQAEPILPSVDERLSEAQLLDLVGDVDGVIAGDDQFTEQVLMKASPKLRVISKWGTGIDAFDQEACKRLGIAIRNTPDAFTDPVADSVLGYILSFARKLPWMDQQVKQGVWDKIPGVSLAESTLGIIGLGNIGTAVALRARGFGMPVLATDIREISRDVIESTGARMVSRSELLQKSDFVSLNCDLNPTSLGLMDDEAFDTMKRRSILINTARGPIVKQQSLVRALNDEKIGGAALDVFEHEPLPAGSPLKEMSNVMLAPHNSNSSPTAWKRVHVNTIKNLFDVLEEKA